MNKYIFIFLILFFLISPSFGQESSYDYFKLVSEKGLNHFNSSKMERDSSYNWKEKLTLIKCNCYIKNISRVKELLSEFAAIGYGFQKVNDLLLKDSLNLVQCGNLDTLFKIKLDSIVTKFLEKTQKDTITKIIHQMYDMDQGSRKMKGLTKNTNYIKVNDSLNLINLKNILLNEELSTKRLGADIEYELYFLCLHLFRNISENEYEILINKLLNMVENDNFLPIYYANIVDERLRTNKSKEYPMYNFLRKERIDEVKQKEVEVNCRKIRAY